MNRINRLQAWIYNAVFSVPVRVKITGIVVLPIVILGLALNYWVTSGLSDWLSYILTDQRVRAAMAAGSRSVLLVTLLASIGSIALAFLLTFLLTRPLLELREMALRVADGELERRAPVWSNDEIGEVATAINTMTDHLVQTQERLTRSNRRLAAINRIIMAAEREGEIHDALYASLESVAEVMGMDTGWVYLRDPERETFHLASWHNVPPALQPLLLGTERGGLCSCQEELQDGRLGAEVQIRTCQRLQEAGLTPERHIVLPIEARGENFGVMNLLCTSERQLSPDDLDLLQSISAQLSEVVANAWLRLKLAEKELARQALLESLVEAQEEERGRLARELHDGAGQMLTNLLVRLKTLEKHAEAPAMRSGLNDVQGAVAETIEQVRELSYRLRPAALEEFGLAVALETLVDEMAVEAGLEAYCDLRLDERRLAPGVDVTLYRIAQEALTNVVRHAGASCVTVTLRQEDGQVLLRIEDDGQGFAPYPQAVQAGNGTDIARRRSLGLISMQERATIVGGSFSVFTAPGEGTAVEVWVPGQPEVSDAG
ncbi:MAG: histidine kinase [Anaerolineae bacterium]|nr:histidine kinase [Anaerolineae bacterium]